MLFLSCNRNDAAFHSQAPEVAVESAILSPPNWCRSLELYFNYSQETNEIILNLLWIMYTTEHVVPWITVTSHGPITFEMAPVSVNHNMYMVRCFSALNKLLWAIDSTMGVNGEKWNEVAIRKTFQNEPIVTWLLRCKIMYLQIDSSDCNYEHWENTV